MRTPTRYTLSDALVKRVAKSLAMRNGGSFGMLEHAVQLLKEENVSDPRRAIADLIPALEQNGASYQAIAIGREAASSLASLNEQVVAFRRSMHFFLDPETVQASDKRSDYAWTEEEG